MFPPPYLILHLASFHIFSTFLSDPSYIFMLVDFCIPPPCLLCLHIQYLPKTDNPFYLITPPHLRFLLRSLFLVSLQIWSASSALFRFALFCSGFLAFPLPLHSRISLSLQILYLTEFLLPYLGFQPHSMHLKGCVFLFVQMTAVLRSSKPHCPAQTSYQDLRCTPLILRRCLEGALDRTVGLS